MLILDHCELVCLWFNCRLMVGVTRSGLITGVRKEGGGSLNVESIDQMVQVRFIVSVNVTIFAIALLLFNKKHLKNVGPIHHCEPPHAHSTDVASGTVARRLRIDVYNNVNDDNA